MHRNFSTTDIQATKKLELQRQVAYHEAGHAVAIYLRNQHCNLPPVYFQITLSETQTVPGNVPWAKVEGGRLIQNLPHSLMHFSTTDQQAYLWAFEADMVNLLAGPLAEAKYVALRDGKDINQQLLSVETLHCYGGSADLGLVQEYIHCFTHTMAQRSEKIEQLLSEAFKFIEHPLYWQVIKQLAQHIIASNQHILACAEIMRIVDAAMLHCLPIGSSGLMPHLQELRR